MYENAIIIDILVNVSQCIYHIRFQIQFHLFSHLDLIRVKIYKLSRNEIQIPNYKHHLSFFSGTRAWYPMYDFVNMMTTQQLQLIALFSRMTNCIEIKPFNLQSTHAWNVIISNSTIFFSNFTFIWKLVINVHSAFPEHWVSSCTRIFNNSRAYQLT